MRHETHYTLEQANAALPWISEQLAIMRSARARLSDEDARGALDDAGPTNGGGPPGVVVSEAFLDLRGGVQRLETRRIILRDLDRGLVDFPSLRNGREVYLCWEEGEPAIGYWHDLDAGHAGRQPL